VLFGLYFAGIVSALVVAWVMKPHRGHQLHGR
jgi:Fe2+ transport system protein B